MLTEEMNFKFLIKIFSKLMLGIILITFISCGSDDNEVEADAPVIIDDPIVVIDPITISSYTPVVDEENISVNSEITVTFSESIEASGIEVNFSLSNSAGDVAGTSTISNTELTFTPSEELDFSTEYTVTVGSASTSEREITAISWGFITKEKESEPAPEPSSSLFFDSFESGDFGKTNESGFRWTDNAWTSIVNATTELAGPRDAPLAKENAASFPGGDWTAFDGTHAMRFRYEAGENMAEERFSLGKAYPDIWIKFWLRVPLNFKHSSNSPSNNKLLSIWMDDYSSKGDGPTVIWEYWGNGEGSSRLAFHYSPGGHQTANAHRQHADFINYPDDQGRWMELAFHIKASSGEGTEDGIIELFRKWEDEEAFTQLHYDNTADLSFPEAGPNGWAAGYIMGWSNPTFEDNTEWLMDSFEVSTESLVK